MTNAAICTNNYYVSHAKQAKVSDLLQVCDGQAQQELRPLVDKYNLYLNANSAGFEQVPTITGDAKVNELRALYNALRYVEQCSFPPEFPTADQVLKLIFFKQTLQNFTLFYGSDISELNATLTKLGAPKDLQFPSSVSGLSRKDVLAYLDRLDNYANGSSAFVPDKNYALEKKADDLLGGRMPYLHGVVAKQAAILDEQAKLKKFVMHLHRFKTETCVPFNWVEPAYKKESLMLPSQACESQNREDLTCS